MPPGILRVPPMAQLTTSVEHLEDNKVRLKVAVPAAEFEEALEAAFRKLAAEVKMPGFRPGKVPRQLLEQRLGPDVAREQAFRDALPRYYAQAVKDEDVDVIAPPEIEITGGEQEGDVEFDAVVEVRPVVELSGYDGLHVEVPDSEIPDDAVDSQVDALRDRFADLEEKNGPLIDGEYATIDITGSIGDQVIDGLSAMDFLYEVGSEGLAPKLDEELRGSKAGAILKFTDTLPERFGEHGGEEVAFQVLVKEGKRKVLPEATDEWVSEVTEFDTLDELRADSRKRLELFGKVQARMFVRDKVLESAADLVEIDAPDPLVMQEMENRLRDLATRLEAQGATIPQYLEATGQEQEAFVAAVREGSTAAVKADLALRAIVAAEDIEVSEDEYEAELARIAERINEEPENVRRDVEQRGMVQAIRSELARSQAIQFLVDHATVVDEAGKPVDLTLPDDPSDSTEQPTTNEIEEPPE
jgi:trigger factor